MNRKIVARLTIQREGAPTMMIEVRKDATFSRFYHFMTQIGRRTSTRRETRTATRNEGLPYTRAFQSQPGLEVLAEWWRDRDGVKSIKLTIYQKRLYKKLINAPANELGQATARAILPPYHLYERPAFREVAA